MKARFATVRVVLWLVLLAALAVPLAHYPTLLAASQRIYLPILIRPPVAPPTDCALAPQLIAPVDGSTLDTLLPLFEYDAGDNPNATELRVEVCYDRDFTEWQHSISSWGRARGRWEHRPSHNFPPATTFYWRAYLLCGEVQGPYSAVWSFTTGSGGEFLPGPQLVSPADGSTLPGLEVTLEWAPVPGAVEYQVNRVDAELNWVTYTTETRCALSALQPDTHYEWYILARNDYAWGEESEHRTFTTGPATQGRE